MTVTSFDVPPVPFNDHAHQYVDAGATTAHQTGAEPVAASVEGKPAPFVPAVPYVPAVFVKKTPREDTLIPRGLPLDEIFGRKPE